MGIGALPRTARSRAALGAVAVVIAVVTSGCTGDSSTSDAAAREPLSATELGWVREYSDWTIDVYDDEFGPSPGRALVRECRQRLAEVGPPPTERLEPAWERAGDVCTLLSASGSVRRAKDVVEDADELVLPLFIDNQELLLSAARTQQSRGDLRLSMIASDEAELAQEVRCWDEPDWRRLVREDNAWTVDSDDPDELYGWQDSDTDRIHMHLGQCNMLRRIRSEDLTQWSVDDQIEAADSLATFVHELHHVLLPDADEDEVECAAAEELERFGRRLGATESETSLLVRLYASDVREELDDEYLSSCDGAFD